MRKTNIESLDLNLLVALKALLEEKHVSRAAERIGLSQPAMSRALGRLRKVLKDPLLVKGATGFTLTPRAIDLFSPLQIIFSEINQIVLPTAIEPSLMQGEIIIASRDHELTTILPKAINYISEHAPGLSFRFIQPKGDDLSLLERQEADFITCGAENSSGTLHRHVLYQEEFICLVSSKNPLSKKELTLKKFLEMKHCLVSTTGYGPGMVDDVLAKKGLKRKIIVRVPYFLAVSYIVNDSDFIVTIPKRLGKIMAQDNNLTLLTPPIQIPKFNVYLYWHTRNQNNPVHQWVRKVIRDNCSLLD